MQYVDSSVIEEMVWQHHKERRYKQNLQDVLVYRGYRYGEFCTLMVYVRTAVKEYNSFYQEIAPTLQDFVNCNKCCLQSVHARGAIDPGCFYQQKKRIRFPEYMKIIIS